MNKLDERDLKLFAAAGGVHLRFNPRLATPWVAWCEADGFNLTAYGNRPWTAVEELYKVVVARGEGAIDLYNATAGAEFEVGSGERLTEVFCRGIK